MSSAAYARVDQQTASPREIGAKALLKAARKLQDVQDNWDTMQDRLGEALLFNRKLWSIFLSAALSDDNPQPIEVRQNIANIGVFILKHTLELQFDPAPAPDKLKSLININRNIAAGLSAV
jgi:flagellar biosynthesis activator protein FlaF